jgi:hypothetical protein
MMSVPFWRASTAALILPTISSDGTTALAPEMPAALRERLVLELDAPPRRPARTAHRALHVDGVAEAGVASTMSGTVTLSAMRVMTSATSLIEVRPMSGMPSRV